MIEWHIAEDAPISHSHPTTPPRRFPYLVLLIFLVSVAVGVGGFVAWRTHRQNQELHRDLTAVILAESNAQAFGLIDEAYDWADPDAPPGWTHNYRKLYSNLPYFNLTWPPDGLAPRLAAVEFDSTTSTAFVSVAWEGASTITERRAYRLVGEQWHRTPLPTPATTEWQHERSQHFLLMAHPGAVEQNEPLLTALETTYNHAVATWPADLFLPSPVLVIMRVEPRELAPLVVGSNSTKREIYLNVAELGVADPTLPLSPVRQREVLAAVNGLQLQMHPYLDNLLWRVMPDQQINSVQQRMGRVLIMLPTLTTYESLLNEAEQSALQAQWRSELQQQWFSPFDYTILSMEAENPFGEYELWDSSFQLLMAYLYQEQGITAGDLATAIRAHPDWDFEQHLTTLSGLSRAKLEATLRSFVMEEDGMFIPSSSEN